MPLPLYHQTPELSRPVSPLRATARPHELSQSLVWLLRTLLLTRSISSGLGTLNAFAVASPGSNRCIDAGTGKRMHRLSRSFSRCVCLRYPAHDKAQLCRDECANTSAKPVIRDRRPLVQCKLPGSTRISGSESVVPENASNSLKFDAMINSPGLSGRGSGLHLVDEAASL